MRRSPRRAPRPPLKGGPMASDAGRAAVVLCCEPTRRWLDWGVSTQLLETQTLINHVVHHHRPTPPKPPTQALTASPLPLTPPPRGSELPKPQQTWAGWDQRHEVGHRPYALRRALHRKTKKKKCQCRRIAFLSESRHCLPIALLSRRFSTSWHVTHSFCIGSSRFTRNERAESLNSGSERSHCHWRITTLYIFFIIIYGGCSVFPLVSYFSPCFPPSLALLVVAAGPGCRGWEAGSGGILRLRWTCRQQDRTQ